MKRFINTVALGFEILAEVMGQTTNAKDAGKKGAAYTLRERRPFAHPQAGFTGIELSIVIAMVGILVAIAIPNFIKFQARSKQSEASAVQAHRDFGSFVARLSLCVTPCDVPSVIYKATFVDPLGNETSFVLRATETSANQPSLLRLVTVERDTSGAVTAIVVEWNLAALNAFVQGQFSGTPVPAEIITVTNAAVFATSFGDAILTNPST